MESPFSQPRAHSRMLDVRLRNTITLHIHAFFVLTQF